MPGMAHGDAVGDGDGGELARRAAGGRDAALRRLRLARQRDVAGRGLVPGGGDADDRLVDLLLGEAHGIEIGAVRRALGPDRDVAARQLRLVEISDCARRPASQRLPSFVPATLPGPARGLPPPRHPLCSRICRGERSGARLGGALRREHAVREGAARRGLAVAARGPALSRLAASGSSSHRCRARRPRGAAAARRLAVACRDRARGRRHRAGAADARASPRRRPRRPRCCSISKAC